MWAESDDGMAGGGLVMYVTAREKGFFKKTSLQREGRAKREKPKSR